MPRKIYPPEHQADIHFVYGYCNGNSSEAVREYHRRFPSRPVPDNQTFINIHRRFRENGLKKSTQERILNLTVHQEARVMNLIVENPTISMRRVGRIVGVSHKRVQSLWKRYGLQSYHYRIAKGLLPADNFARIAFCQRMNEFLMQDPQFLSKVLWTGEALFTNRRLQSKSENPDVWESSDKHEFSVNMWAGILNNKLIGPIEISHRFNSNNYLSFLRSLTQLEFFEDVDLDTIRNMWLQHDDASDHYGIQVQDYLNEEYPERWIGCGSPTLAWPARSPDLTPLDFYVWGTLKSKVYEQKILSRDHLLQRIEEAANEMHITEVNLNVQIRTRLNLCLEFSGGHFEDQLS